MTAVTLAVCALAAYRLTQLVAVDTITAGLRRRLLVRFPGRPVPSYDDLGHPVPILETGTNREVGVAMQLKAHWIVELVNCPWCLGVWFSAGTVGFAYAYSLVRSWQWALLGWLACSAIVGALSDMIG